MKSAISVMHTLNNHTVLKNQCAELLFPPPIFREEKHKKGGKKGHTMKKLYKNVHYQIACLLNQFNKGNCVYFHSGRVQIKTLIQDRSLGKILVLQIKGLNSSTDRALEPSLKQRHLLLASNTICFGKAKLFYSTMLSIYNSQEHEIFHFLPVFKIIIVLQQSQTAG